MSEVFFDHLISEHYDNHHQKLRSDEQPALGQRLRDFFNSMVHQLLYYHQRAIFDESWFISILPLKLNRLDFYHSLLLSISCFIHLEFEGKSLLDSNFQQLASIRYNSMSVDNLKLSFVTIIPLSLWKKYYYSYIWSEYSKLFLSQLHHQLGYYPQMSIPWIHFSSHNFIS